MRRGRLALIVALVVLLQIGFVPALRPGGVVPNLVLCLVALVGLYGSATMALAVALGCGLLVDLASSTDFGLRVALLVLVALVAGLVYRAGLELSGPVVELVLVAAGTVVANAAVLVDLVGVTGSWPLGLVVGKLGLELVLNLGCTLLLRPVVRWGMGREAASLAGPE